MSESLGFDIHFSEWQMQYLISCVILIEQVWVSTGNPYLFFSLVAACSMVWASHL